MNRIILYIQCIFCISLFSSFLYAEDGFGSFFKEDAYRSPKLYDTLGIAFSYYYTGKDYSGDEGGENYGADETAMAFSVAYNALRLSYTGDFYGGVRYTYIYDFMLRSSVSPYIGISYVKGTNIFEKTVNRDVDGMSALLGISLNYFKYIKPYMEYVPLDSVLIFGARFSLNMNIKKFSGFDITN